MKREYKYAVFGLTCIVVAVVAIRILLLVGGTSDDDLRSLYFTHKAECELLRQMFLEDEVKSDWQRFAVIPFDETNARLDGITPVRFERYKELLKHFRNASLHGDKGAVYFVIGGFGWAGEGRRQGIVWMEKPPIEIVAKDKKSRFVPIEDGWYVFDFHQ
jgi:hypothetical protein